MRDRQIDPTRIGVVHPDTSEQRKARAHLALRYLLGRDTDKEFAMFADMLGLLPPEKRKTR